MTCAAALIAGLLLPERTLTAAAWLLPALALTSLTLVLARRVDVVYAAVGVGVVWVTTAVSTHFHVGQFAAFGAAAQLACLAVAAGVVAPSRRGPGPVRDQARRYVMTGSVLIEGVTKTFGRSAAVAGADFTAGRGVTGLLGPNGAGKTTLLRMLATVLAPDSGRLQLLGHDPATPSGRLAVRRRLGYLPQEPGFHRGMTVFSFVDYVAILKELTDRRARHDEVRRVIDLVGLAPLSGKRIRALSGGMRRRVGLAQALLGDPDLVILDDPTAGLDPELRLRFREIVSRIGEGRTVVLSTHQTEDVTAVCQQVVVLHQGRSRFAGTPAALVERAAGRVWLDKRAAPARSWPGATGTGWCATSATRRPVPS